MKWKFGSVSGERVCDFFPIDDGKKKKENRIGGYFLNMVFSLPLYLCPEMSFLLNGQILDVFPFKPGMKHRYSLSPLFNVVLVLLTIAIRPDQSVRDRRIRQGSS